MDDRRRLRNASSGFVVKPSSRATLDSTGALISRCVTVRMRSDESNGAGGPTTVGETAGAITASVALDLYCFGRYRTRAAPTTVDATMGTISHHLRRLTTDR